MKKGWMVCLALVTAAGVIGLILTSDEAQKVQKINADEAAVRNIGWEITIQNPLCEDEYPELTQTVKDYYSQLKERSDFVEAYDNIQVYTKKGRYQDSYVAFVRYDMKIKDIYTKVPGLGTLYIERDNMDGEYRVDAGIREDEAKEYATAVSIHEDVQALFAETKEEYTAAVQSDALLQEALIDLKNAYENSAGS